MLIGELSERTGLSRDTIRFYEKEGLIAVGRKERRFNNYKEYSEETFQKLVTIKRIKGFGFTLNETAEFLQLIDSNAASCDNVAAKIGDKVELITQKIKELELLKSSMIESVQTCVTCCQPASATENCALLTDNVR